VPSPRPPQPQRGSKQRGAGLWKSLHGAYDFTDAAEKVVVLEQACRTADVVDRLQKLVDETQDLRVTPAGDAVMGRPRRRSHAVGDRSPAALANRLRETVRAFKPSTDPEDLQEHLRVVLAMMGDDLALPVINAAGLSVAEWYRRAPELSAKGPALRIVK
jgi:hypothetical protein